MAAPKNIKELLEALKNSPQEKEGSFRVSTWKMVLQSICDLQDSIGQVEKTTQEAIAKSPNAEEIKKSLKDDINKADANKIIF